MSDTIAATEGALRRGADVVRTAHQDVADSTRRVSAELDDLAAAWEGEAATAYSGLLQNWQDDVAKLNATLARLEEALRATERDQAATEVAHQQTISGLGAMMGGN